ncbi:hypothetical protein [Blastomonas aquatica]|uniref:Uncharacterized protein n=1 Tax=Blastomonas aquatica TaxID=1510276 RepID=A0ABQ1IVL0_9SPHN|nr:hypothetical protein [Blastomonas aquatica]GGB52118.1 hypothetical protein GCM10010833_03580 [Blastomonas aquatica]
MADHIGDHIGFIPGRDKDSLTWEFVRIYRLVCGCGRHEHKPVRFVITVAENPLPEPHTIQRQIIECSDEKPDTGKQKKLGSGEVNRRENRARQRGAQIFTC